MSNGKTVMIPLLIEKYLRQYSDPAHPLSIMDMQKLLEETGRKAERRTIYASLEALKENGETIHMVKKDRKTGYYMERVFRQEEIFLLCSDLSDSTALSETTITTMQEKLKSLLSVHEQKQVPSLPPFVAAHQSIDLLPSIHLLMDAIASTRPITFRYFDLDCYRQRVYRKNTYRMVPYAIASQNGKYYCILYSFTHRDFGNYRIDKMDDIVVEENTVPSVPFNLADHMRTSFQMYHGHSQTVTCRFDLSFAGYVYDHFATKDIIISHVDDTGFTASLRTAVTPTLISWIMQFHDRIEVLEPVQLKQQLFTHGKQIYDQYRKEFNDESEN